MQSNRYIFTKAHGMMARLGIRENTETKVAHLHSHSARSAAAKGARFISELCKV
jgi:hypothetical protein